MAEGHGPVWEIPRQVCLPVVLGPWKREKTVQHCDEMSHISTPPKTHWTFSSEDYVGKISMLASSVSPGVGSTKISAKVAPKYRVLLHFLLTREGMDLAAKNIDPWERIIFSLPMTIPTSPWKRLDRNSLEKDASWKGLRFYLQWWLFEKKPSKVFEKELWSSCLPSSMDIPLKKENIEKESLEKGKPWKSAWYTAGAPNPIVLNLEKGKPWKRKALKKRLVPW